MSHNDAKIQENYILLYHITTPKNVPDYFAVPEVLPRGVSKVIWYNFGSLFGAKCATMMPMYDKNVNFGTE